MTTEGQVLGCSAKSQKTTKTRHDTAVQGTNDSSIVSKCSMAKFGYFQDDFLKKFVAKESRRAPLIHRGYFIRAKTIDFIVQNFLKLDPIGTTGKKQIIALGAGFDSSYFRLKSEGSLTDTVYVELDFPEVVRRKADIISQTPELTELIGSKTCTPVNPDAAINTNCYKLVGVDLTLTSKVEELLTMCGIRRDNPTLFLSECVLTYIKHQRATDIVRWANLAFPQSTFVLYEQINPWDPFGSVMLNHYRKIGSPLRCVERYPTMRSQIQRFQQVGWSWCEGLDMNQFYHFLLSPEERGRVESLELFDEYEEWHLKCSHYMVLCAYSENSPSLLTGNGRHFGENKLLAAGQGCMKEVQDKYLNKKKPQVTCVTESEENSSENRLENSSLSSDELIEKHSVHTVGNVCPSQMNSFESESTEIEMLPKANCVKVAEDSNTVQRFGHCCLKVDNHIWILGGFGLQGTKHCRLKDVTVTDVGSGKSIVKSGTDFSSNIILDRLYHTAVSVEDDKTVLVIGGRQSPKCGVNQIARLTTYLSENGEGGITPYVECVAQATFEPARWRHSAVSCRLRDSEKVMVYGGKSADCSALGDCQLYDVRSQTWENVSTSGDSPVARHSHSAALWEGHMVVSGGLDEDLHPLDSIHLLNLEVQKWHPLQMCGNIKPRYSHTSHVVDDVLLLVGGVNCDHTPPGLAAINLLTGHCHEYQLPHCVDGEVIMYHNHASLLTDDRRLTVIGGGGNCFSFGTHLNRTPIVLDIAPCLQHFISSSQKALL